jgi:hypothetical protein
MKFIYSIVLAFALLVTATTTVSAQEAEMQASTTVDVEMNDSEGAMNDDSEVLTDEEESILEEAEELEEAEIDSAEDLEGEIILRTEEDVVIKKTDGSTIKVDAAVYKKSRPGAHRRLWAVTTVAPVGSVVTTATVTTTEGGVVITATGGKKTTVAGNVAVSKNGNEASLDDVSENDEVIALYDEDGNLIGLEIVDESGDEMVDDMSDDEEKSGVLGIVLALVAIIIIAGVVLRKRK